MWLRVLKSRPIHMAVVSGVSVYVLLTVIGMLIHESKHTASNAHQRYIAIVKNVQRDDRGVLQVEERDVKQVKDVQGIGNGHQHSKDALVAAPFKDSNFIFRGKPADESPPGPDKLDNIAKLLQNIEHKLAKEDRDIGQSINNDFKDVQRAIKELIGGKEGDSEQRDAGDLLRLEVPNEAEPLAKVDIDTLPFLKDLSQPLSHCPKTVQTLAKYSKWFRERYEHGIKLFANFEDIQNYQSYHKLDHYVLPFGFRRTKREQLGKIMQYPNFTNMPLFTKRERPRCLRCAVVGCGGILNGSNAGEEIDSHDLVFRLNRAISSGRFAQDVGIKTSMYTFFPESMHAMDVIDQSAMYVFAMFKQYDVDYLESIVKDLPPPIYVQRGRRYKLKKPPIPANRLKVLHPDFSRYVFTRYLDGKSHRPTTGALVVMLAVHVCDEVTIYGFGYDQRFSLHYYDKAFVSHTDKATALHDVDNERGLWNKLHEEGVIRFFKRDL